MCIRDSFWSEFERSLETHLVANRPVQVFVNEQLDLHSRVGESEEDFRLRCSKASEAAADEAIRKLRDKYEARIDRVKDEISKADIRVKELEGEASAKKQDELLSGAGDLLGALLGGRKSSNPLGRAAGRRAASAKAKARVEAASERLTDKQQDLVELEDELADEIAEISDRYSAMVDEIEIIEVGLEKADIQVADLKLVWIPV